MTDSTCNDCGKVLAPFGSVHLGSPQEGYRELCLACYNTRIAAHCGVHFQHTDFQPIILTDVGGVAHRFEFALTLLGDRVELRAHEVHDDPKGGYEFSVQSFHPEGEPLELFRQLFEKMRRALAQKYLRQDDEFGLQIAESGIVRGYVSCDLDSDVGERLPMLVVDGKPISWERFGQMLMTYEGFSFKLEIYDPTEER
jgi:hypothetical protein